MDFGWLLVFGVFWIVFSAVREGAAKVKRESRRGAAARRPELPDLREAFADASPGLRALLDAIEQSRGTSGRLPPPVVARREAETPEDFTSLETGGEEAITERAPERVQRKEVDLDEESILVAQKRRALADRIDVPARSSAPRAHAVTEPVAADATSVATRLPTGSIRQAMIWQEILGRPRALRDD